MYINLLFSLSSNIVFQARQYDNYFNRFLGGWAIKEFIKSSLKNKHAYARRAGYLKLKINNHRGEKVSDGNGSDEESDDASKESDEGGSGKGGGDEGSDEGSDEECNGNGEKQMDEDLDKQMDKDLDKQSDSEDDDGTWKGFKGKAKGPRKEIGKENNSEGLDYCD